jgi:hypothetical protein
MPAGLFRPAPAHPADKYSQKVIIFLFFLQELKQVKRKY